MKLESIIAQNIEPIRHFAISDMGSVIIIAGANGSGKSRLKQAIVQAFQNPAASPIGFTVRSTRSAEEQGRWGSETIEVAPNQASQAFVNYMNSRTRGGSYVGTVIQIDAQRAVQNMNWQPLSLATPDPDDQDIDYRYFLNPFTNRWNETVNKIYQKVANRDTKIAQYNKQNPGGQIADALGRNPDPFVPYQDVFRKLLPGKELEPIDPRVQQEFQYRNQSNHILSFSTLSSGEQEVVKIAFDLLAKRISHCVFLIDEPELHLHPTLTFRLIETLREIGGGTNQFIFFTHSADLISTYYATGNVYFIDADQSGENQAHRLSDLDTGHSGLVRAMSENLGLFAVGKKLVFIEGRHASRDRLTYHAIAQKYFPEAHFIPTGGVDGLMGLSQFAGEVERAIFGISFFMVRDRDGLSDAKVAELERNGRLRCLPRRHIENYFLDPEVLARVASRFCLPDQNMQNPSIIAQKLLELAQRALSNALVFNMKEYFRVNRSMEIPTVRDIQSKSADVVEQEFLQNTAVSFKRLSDQLEPSALHEAFCQERGRLEQSLQTGEWISVFPGKLLFEGFCGQEGFSTDPYRVRQAYVDIALSEKPEVFADISTILSSFREA